MKTKLTLTIRKSVIDIARRQSKRTGKSISQLFEDFFEQSASAGQLKTESQRAAGRLLQSLESAERIPTLDDKVLIIKHVARKYS